MNEVKQLAATPENETQLVTVSLTAYDWHAVLTVLEFAMKFVNVDTAQAVRLYEIIASRLSGMPVIVHQHKKQK